MMERIKLNVAGGTNEVAATQDNWQDGWDMVHGLANATDLVSEDSSISGSMRVPVACKSEVKRVNERFGTQAV